MSRFDDWRADGREIAVIGLGKSGIAATRLLRREGLAVYVWERLVEAGLPAGVALHRVRVQEGANLYSEYYGEP